MEVKGFLRIDPFELFNSSLTQSIFAPVKSASGYVRKRKGRGGGEERGSEVQRPFECETIFSLRLFLHQGVSTLAA